MHCSNDTAVESVKSMLYVFAGRCVHDFDCVTNMHATAQTRSSSTRPGCFTGSCPRVHIFLKGCQCDAKLPCAQHSGNGKDRFACCSLLQNNTIQNQIDSVTKVAWLYDVDAAYWPGRTWCYSVTDAFAVEQDPPVNTVSGSPAVLGSVSCTAEDIPTCCKS